MKKKIIIVLIIFTLVLVTGCEKNKEEVKNKNQKTLTCTKLNSSSIEFGSTDVNYIIDSNDVFVYSKNKLKSAEMKETYDFSDFLESKTLYRKDYVKLYKTIYDAFECSTDFFSNVDALSGGVKECNKEWEENAFSRIYTMDTEILKDRDDFKTIEKAKDFYERNLFKCKIK